MHWGPHGGIFFSHKKGTVCLHCPKGVCVHGVQMGCIKGTQRYQWQAFLPIGLRCTPRFFAGFSWRFAGNLLFVGVYWSGRLSQGLPPLRAWGRVGGPSPQLPHPSCWEKAVAPFFVFAKEPCATLGFQCQGAVRAGWIPKVALDRMGWGIWRGKNIQKPGLEKLLIVCLDPRGGRLWVIFLANFPPGRSPDGFARWGPGGAAVHAPQITPKPPPLKLMGVFCGHQKLWPMVWKIKKTGNNNSEKGPWQDAYGRRLWEKASMETPPR